MTSLSLNVLIQAGNSWGTFPKDQTVWQTDSYTFALLGFQTGICDPKKEHKQLPCLYGY